MAEPDVANMSPEEYARLQKENCIFCKIIKGEIPSKKVFEDDMVVAIQDINPAIKGHSLMMTKEHYPILPLIPPDVFKHLFRTAKYVAIGIREAVVCPGTTLFIANGSLAGQQSPHFLFHIIPREAGDDLTNFILPTGKGEGNEAYTPSIKAGLASVMRGYLQREGLWRGETIVEGVVSRPTEEESTPLVAPPVSVETKANLADTIFQNPNLKQMIIEQPEQIEELTNKNPEVARLFSGVDIRKLSVKLREIEERKKPKKREEQEQEEAKKPNLDKISKLFR